MSQNDGTHSAKSSEGDSVASHARRALVEQACVQWESDLKSFLRSVVRDPQAAEDVFQKTVVRAMEASDSVREETLRGWLFRMALNEARQMLRELRRRAMFQEKLAEQWATERPEKLWAVDLGGMSDSLVQNREQAEAVSWSLSRLPPEQQQVIRSRIYDGLTFAEISMQLNQPLGTVLTWMRRGLQRLKEDSSLRNLWIE